MMRPEAINAILRNLEPHERQPFFDAEVEAGEAAGHAGKAESEGMEDRHTCQCGWDSGWYHDGDVYAYDAWLRHLADEGVKITYPVATQR